MPDINELLSRVIAVAKDALANLSTPVTADGVPYFLHVQETFPYFTARVAAVAVPLEGDGSEDFDRDTYTVVLRLIGGQADENNAGRVEYNIYTYMPALKSEFNQREFLQSASYPDAMTSLIWSRVIAISGLSFFERPNNLAQVGFEITLTCLFDEYIPQDYP